MDKRTAMRRHKRGLRAGKVVEFYPAKPKPRQQGQAEESFEPCAAIDVLKQVLENAAGLKDVLIFLVDANDQVGLISNLDGPAENLYLLKRCEMQLIAATKSPEPTGPRRA